MCGLAGYFGAGGPAGRHRGYLGHAGELLAHRGPDGLGFWQGAGAGLVHRRLAVIDLSPQAAQPMATPDGALVLAWNGEIYNHLDLRRELEAGGARFRSRSDTEVILLGWRRWGPGLLDRLDGMFAMALIDTVAGELVLARDRFGEKPLVWTRADGTVLFGSAIKALLPWPGFDPAPDLAVLHDYLAFQYCPGTSTAFAGIQRVEPGTALVFRRGRTDGPRLLRYWTAPAVDPAKASRPRGALVEELRAHLDAAVRSRMVADVPVGAFLSGGIDSSAVVSRMARSTTTPLNSFSIGFARADHDEREPAQQVAGLFGTTHHMEELGPGCIETLGQVAWHHDEPFADPSALATFAVARLARPHVTVALGGDGGDELMMGYRRYGDMAALDAGTGRWGAARPGEGTIGCLARGLHGMIPPALARVRPFGGIRRRLRLRGQGAPARYGATLFAFSGDDRHDLYGPALESWRRNDPARRLDPWFQPGQPLAASAARADLATYLPGDILVKVDTAAMAVGLETRSPLLARGLAEFALTLPADVHMPGGGLKQLFREAASDVLPPAILNRPKMGFGVPVEHWLRGPWRSFASDILLDGRFEQRGILARGAAERLLNEHQKGRSAHTIIWTLIMLETWFRIWVDCRNSALHRQFLSGDERSCHVAHDTALGYAAGPPCKAPDCA